jgi:acylphosphatase
METWHMIAKGKVQGVGYRAACEDLAIDLALGGWVRNTADGTVEVMAYGPTERLETLRAWKVSSNCSNGGRPCDGVGNRASGGQSRSPTGPRCRGGSTLAPHCPWRKWPALGRAGRSPGARGRGQGNRYDAVTRTGSNDALDVVPFQDACG